MSKNSDIVEKNRLAQEKHTTDHCTLTALLKTYLGPAVLALKRIPVDPLTDEEKEQLEQASYHLTRVVLSLKQRRKELERRLRL